MADPVIPVEDYPAWQREPAKMVGWVITAVAFAASIVTILLSPDVLEILPDSWDDELRTASVTLAGAGLILARLQALLTRNGIGPTGNGIDGVYSPATVAVARDEGALDPHTPDPRQPS